jgi:type VII secretion integral membrane protein EccD
VAAVTLGLMATGFAAVAGFLAVPDGPGPPNALLAAMAAGVVAVLAMRATGCGALTFTTVCCFALVIAVAALATVVITAPLQVMGSLTTLASLALLEVSARLSIAWAGLSPRLPARLDGRHVGPAPDQLQRSALRADDLLTCLVVASAAAAATGAACTALGAYTAVGARSGAVSFAAVTGAVLLLRARSHPDFIKTLTLLATGTAALSAAFVVAGAAPQCPVWMVTGIAAPVAVAMCLGFVVPALTLSPVARRGVELIEYLALIAIVPLACWTCGFYSVARGVHLL